MSEALPGPESAPQQPQADAVGRENPGYPPPGQQETLAALRQQEAATRNKEDPAAFLAGLETVSSSSSFDQKILKALEAASKSVTDPSQRLAIVLADINLTDEQRSQLEGDRKLMGMLRRPELNDKIKNDCLQCIAEVVPLDQTPETNPETEARQAQLAAAESRVAEIDAATVRAETNLAETQAQDAELAATEAENQQTIDEVQSEKQAEVARLAAENDRADAEAERADVGEEMTKALLKSTGLNEGTLSQYHEAAVDIINTDYAGEQHKEQRDNALEALNGFIEGHRATLNQIESLFTEEERQQVFGGALAETVALNFAATNQADIYANVFTAISAGNLSDDRKRQLQEQVAIAIGAPETVPYIRNGADIRFQGREMIGGEYVYNSVETGLPVRPGVVAYMKNGRQMLHQTDLGLDTDITGLSDHQIAMYAQVRAGFHAAEKFGATALIEDMYPTHYDFLSRTAFDAEATRRANDFLCALMPGTFAGRDGSIINFSKSEAFFRAAMRLQVSNEQALGMQSDAGDTKQWTETLGLTNEGEPDLEIIKAFSGYLQENLGRSNLKRDEVQGYLSKLFPSRVDPPQAV